MKFNLVFIVELYNQDLEKKNSKRERENERRGK